MREARCAVAASMMLIAMSASPARASSESGFCVAFAVEAPSRPDRDAAQRVLEAMGENMLAHRRLVLSSLATTDDGAEAWLGLDALARLSCARALVSSDAARARVSDILKDPAFYGEREAPDLIDKLLARLQAWFLSFLESEGMRQYAGVSRVVYLSGLALALLYLVYRTLRERRRRVARERAAEDGVHVERARRQASAELLSLANDALAREEPRVSMRLAHLALLARLGETEASALSPARTNREILRELEPALRDTVRPSLVDFDATFYAGHADLGAARRFVDGVGATLRRLGEAA